MRRARRGETSGYSGGAGRSPAGRSWLALLAGLALLAAPRAAPLEDLPARVTEALRGASSAVQSHARGGGYPSEIDPASGDWLRPALAADQVAVGPDASAAVGLALVEAFRVSGDAVHRDGALAAARALAEGQLASGGWAATADLGASPPSYVRRQRLHSVPAEGRADVSSLLPALTPAALRLLFGVVELTGDSGLSEAADYGLRALLNAQLAGGGWPAAMPLPADQGRFAQVEASAAIIELLLAVPSEAAHTAARRAGDLLLQTLGLEPPGWAAAYDGLRPLGEVSGPATDAAIEALLRLHTDTGQERYVTALEPLLPLLADRPESAAELRRQLRQPGLPPRQPSRLELATRTADRTPRVLELLAAMQDDRWLDDGRLRISRFVENMTFLTTWLREYEPLPERQLPTETRPPQHRRM